MFRDEKSATGIHNAVVLLDYINGRLQRNIGLVRLPMSLLVL